MSPEQTIEHLETLKLKGMAAVLRRHFSQVPRPQLDAETLLAQMVDAQLMTRHQQRLTSRLKQAHFKEPAHQDQIDWKHARGLRKQDLLQILGGGWLQNGQNVLITGATGLGKTFLACAIGHRLCQDGHTVIFKRTTRLFDELVAARGDGTYAARLRKLMATDVLILDDFALEPMNADARHDLLEIMEDRYGIKSTVITSQFEPDHWHTAVGAPTHADSILDRLVHNAMRIPLQGESIRKTRGKSTPLTKEKTQEK